MAVNYGKYSPYLSTSMFGNYLDIASIPNIPAQVDDITLTINNNYKIGPIY